MSVRALEWVRTVRDVTTLQRCVLWVLADMADEDGVAWPRVALIGERASARDRATRQALIDLEKQGLLIGEKGVGKVTRWRLRVADARRSSEGSSGPRKASRPSHQMAGSKAPTPAFAARVSEGDPGICCPIPRHLLPKTPAADADRSIIEASGKHSVLRTAAPALPSSVAAEDSGDARTTLFRGGLHRLRDLTGKPDRPARGFLGRLLRDAGDDAALVGAVLAEAEDRRPADPAAWIIKAIHTRTGQRAPAARPRRPPSAVAQWAERLGLLPEDSSVIDGLVVAGGKP